MTVTDREQLVREALTTILNADAGVRAVCGGRTTGLAIEWLAWSLSTVLPVAVVDVSEVDFGTNQIALQVDGVANGPVAGKTARELCEAAAAAITYPALLALGLDITPLAVTRESVRPDDPHFAGREGDPTLHQARVTIPLLYME
jgi:hypothetical protein